ncbi:MAG: PepSY domain-containing protein [Calothrix sp. C42_A2020_038]|nr:PepSY domain-containing protein [Calothrix sp. C42_A2020_038]
MRHKNLTLQRYLGILVALVLAVLGLTGSILVFHKEIDSVFYPVSSIRVTATPSIEQIADVVKQNYPDSNLLSISLNSQPIHVVVSDKDKFFRQRSDIYINLDNNQIVSVMGRNGTITGIISQIHTSFLAGEAGHVIVGVCGLLLIARAIGGLIIFPGWKKLSTGFKIRWKAPSHLITYDFHKIIGIVAAVFLILSGITGALLVFDKEAMILGYRLSMLTPIAEPVSVVQQDAQKPTLDNFLHTAETILPGGETTFIYPAINSKDTVRIRKRLPGDFNPNGSSYVYLNQYNGEVLQVKNIKYAPWFEKVLAWMYPIHIGKFAGAPMRFIYVILGLTPVALFITGFVIFWSKTYGAMSRKV